MAAVMERTEMCGTMTMIPRRRVTGCMVKMRTVTWNDRVCSVALSKLQCYRRRLVIINRLGH